MSLGGQVEELRAVVETHGDPPIVLIGFSWGAWLAFIVTARYPALVDKLILVGSAPFEEAYVAELHRARLERLNPEERAEFKAISEALTGDATGERDSLLARLGELAGKCDAYDPIVPAADGWGGVKVRYEVFRAVWSEAEQMRRNGELLQLGRHIACRVLAIHGAYDPHPAEGVREPLSAVLDEFRFILLEKCGHRPWIEREARHTFYRILRAEVSHDRSAATAT